MDKRIDNVPITTKGVVPIPKIINIVPTRARATIRKSLNPLFFPINLLRVICF